MARNVHAPQRVDDLPLFAPPHAQKVVQMRDATLARVEDASGPRFALLAETMILSLLDKTEKLSGEELVLTCRDFGIAPPRDDRAFGPVFMRLLRAGRIERVGFVPRAKGNGTQGGSVYRRGAVR